MTMPTEAILAAIISALEEDTAAARRLAELLAPKLEGSLQTRPPEPDDGWLDTARAAQFLGITVGALHKLTAARAIPFEQDGPGCKCWFRRSELDRWRRGGSRL